jgi:PKD repeat protein
MFIVFMVSRLRRASALAFLVILSGFITVACQKVPLLAPTGSTITLTPSATAVPVGGTADIIAQVIRASGSPPHEGTHITFTTNLGRIEPSEADTDINGRVVVKFVASGGSGTATISAISGGVAVAAANAVKIQVGAAAVGSVSASASPATLPNTGGTSTITATVIDISGNPLPNVPVTFAIDTTTGSSGAGTLSATTAITDANGRAQVTLTTNRTTTVAASAGVGTASGTPPTGGTQTGKVTVTVNTTSTIAITPPTASPIVGQAATFALAYNGTNTSPIVRVTVDWGDGQTQSFNGQTPSISHTYRSPGPYLIIVTGVDGFGDTTTTTTSVNVLPRPALVVSVSVTTTNPTPNTTTVFAIVAQPTSGNAITSITIDFGDGTSGTLMGNASSVQHVYTAPGTYVVTVIATDSSGAQGSAATVLVVSNPVTARFTFTPNPGKVGQPVTFDASGSSSGSGIASYSWTFGDGTSGSGVSVPHTYTAANTYNVVLTVVDNAGKTASTSQQVVVQP